MSQSSGRGDQACSAPGPASGFGPPEATQAALQENPSPGADSPATDEDDWRGRPVLITGGLGFIGSTLAIRLCELGAQVTAIDSLVPEYGGNLHNLSGYAERIRINLSDIRDRFQAG